MSFKLLQLNSFAEVDFSTDCGFSDETPDGNNELDLRDLKERVKNYRDVMIEDYNIHSSKFSQTIPVDIKNIQTLISINGNDLAGVRIYLSKKTRDKANNDYELILVPCIKKEDNGRSYFEDKIDPAVLDSHIFVSDCRRPPDCNTKGALLI